MQTHHGPAAGTAAVATHRTALGELVLAATDEALVLCCYGTPEAAGQRLARGGLRPVGTGDATDAQARMLSRTRDELDAYLEGEIRRFDVPTDLALATPFCRSTVLALPGFVPYGRRAGYAELAAALGRPAAARAVGTALGANPLCVVLPCHRIVSSTGALAGYAGGAAAKRRLLDLEASA